MSEYLSFEGEIEPVTWGRATHTILRVPVAVARELEAAGASRVEGEIAEYPVNLRLTRATEVDGVFVWAGKSLLDAAGLRPGERVTVRLRAAPDAAVELPTDIAAVLRAEGLTAAWEALTPGRRRGLLYKVSTAKKAKTRARRIAELIETIRGRA